MTDNNKNSVLKIEAENGIINDVATVSTNSYDAYPNTSATAVALGLNDWGAGYFYCPDDAVWFKFTPSTTKYYTIRSDGSLDVMAQLYNNANVLLNQADDEGPGMNFRMVAQLTAGQTYYIKVTAFGAVGAFNIIVSEFVYVEAVTINPEYITMSKNSTYNLTANVAPSYATNKSIYWQSGNTNVATVDSNGRVTAVGGGETTICAYSQDGSNKYGCCRVVVPVAVQGINLGWEEYFVEVGKTEEIEYTIIPTDATNQSVAWCSSNPDVVEVNASTGILTGKKAGVATITGTTMDGSFSASCEVWVKGKTPVFLLHGRTSNSTDVWGVNNNIPSGKNDDFDSNINAEALNGKKYIDVISQEINDYEANEGETENLGIRLQNSGYNGNLNLFVFNYPNEDAVKYSAQKFKAYIENLISYVRNSNSNEMKACFYASRDAYNNNNYKINIVGHSMGGLVARYYIENLGQDNHVDKLITICTPHWGSGYANLSNLTGDLFGIKLHALCDHDLDFGSAMYGGSNSTTVNCDKGTCPESNYIVTPALQYQRQRSTKYYAIAGIDFPGGSVFQNDYYFEMPTNYTTYQQINNFMEDKQVYRYEPSDFNPKSVGDNMVGFMSQIGWTENIGNTPNKKIPMEKIFIDVDTNGGNGGGFFVWEVVNGFGSEIFHNKAPHRTPICNKVIEYLED